MRKAIVVSVIIFFAVLYLTSGIWLSAYGRYLVVDEKPQKCDAIVILGGETIPRVARGAELYKEGYANVLIMSGGGGLTSRITEADLMLIEAGDLGVPQSAVILEKKSESTYENAVYVKQIILEKDYKSFLLVTSNYHTRRARSTFDSVFKDTGVQFITIAAPDPKFSPDSWWKSGEGQQKALTELADMVIYRIKYL
ncbi:MAG: YdcF family protein [Desulfocucumaceae bacterium]